MSVKEPKYISLKEAAQISGYSSDYVGQLIRGGKLPGKQVFSNVAWMTTVEALDEYMNKDKVDRVEKVPFSFQDMRDKLFSLEFLSRIYIYCMWTTIVILGMVVLFLTYVLAVSIDHRIEEGYLEKIEYDR